ncbi:MAG TPA: DNA polymerase III subunit beta, partial [Bacilli bacterium]|nr:DNA polymerase III subunit beta [Bacilli bacterium]HQB79811.1 DNA polymerase III subunit beta [Bacilli bacterium]
MNFTINRDLLLENLTNVSRALSTKTPMPVLTGIKFEITKSKMFLTASNNEISIQAQINEGNKLKLEGEGSFVVPGKILIEIIRKLDANEVQFKAVEDNVIKIYANRSDFTLNALEKDNFPLISFAESKSFIKLDIGTLKQIIRKTTFATSLSESR